MAREKFLPLSKCLVELMSGMLRRELMVAAAMRPVDN
jgi:hypothetical protein